MIYKFWQFFKFKNNVSRQSKRRKVSSSKYDELDADEWLILLEEKKPEEKANVGEDLDLDSSVKEDMNLKDSEVNTPIEKHLKT